MLRSIGAARGAVFVAAGAENVRPPRLPELPDTRASASTTENDNRGHDGQKRKHRTMVRALSVSSPPGPRPGLSAASISEADSAT